MTSVVYKIEIKGYDKFYIGSAKNFEKRRAHHLSQLRSNRHSNKYLQNIFTKYGEENFSFLILEEVSKPELLLEIEQKWIEKYNFDTLINMCPKAGNTLGKFHSEETRQKIKDSHHDISGKKNPMFGKTGELSPNYGIKRTEETKRKISESLKGRQGSWKGKKRKEHSEKMSGENNPFHGKTHSEEMRKKLSQIAKDRNRRTGGKKITLEVAREIRERYKKGDISITSLAKEYGLSRTYCGRLIKGEFWNESR